MKVILLNNMDKLGKAGDVVDVAAGYGRNFLIPRGYAEALTRKSKKQVEIRKQLAERKAEKDLETAREIAQKIEGSIFDVKAKSGPRGKLYGAITTPAIAEAVSQAIGSKIDKRLVTVAEPIRMLGGYDINLKLHPEVSVDFKINVIAAEGSWAEKE